jgi:hemerythrin
MEEVEFEGESRKAHLQQHQEFNQYISTLLGNFSTEKKIDLVQLYSFLANWLVKHITVEDKKLGEHIRMFLYGE